MCQSHTLIICKLHLYIIIIIVIIIIIIIIIKKTSCKCTTPAVLIRALYTGGRYKDFLLKSADHSSICH